MHVQWKVRVIVLDKLLSFFSSYKNLLEAVSTFFVIKEYRKIHVWIFTKNKANDLKVQEPSSCNRKHFQLFWKIIQRRIEKSWINDIIFVIGLISHAVSQLKYLPEQRVAILGLPLKKEFLFFWKINCTNFE